MMLSRPCGSASVAWSERRSYQLGLTRGVAAVFRDPGRPCDDGADRFTAAEPDSVDRRNAALGWGSVVKVTAVRTRYEHIAAGWRRATSERRAGLLGELELLALQLPPVVQPEDPDRAEIIALRAAISQLITEITIGLADPT